MDHARRWLFAASLTVFLFWTACSGSDTQVSQAAGSAQNLSQSASTPSRSAKAMAGQSYRMKLVQVMDQNGFERPIPSGSILIPSDWQHQGATQWNLKDSCNSIQSSFRASGTDGRAFEVFPEYNWVWADDPTYLKADLAQKAQMGVRGCDVMPPMSAADYVRRNLARVRPGAEIISIDPMPKLMEGLQQQARQIEQMAAQYGMRQQVRGDVVRVRLRYSLNGQPMEEWVIARTLSVGTLGPSFNMATGAMTQAFTYNCNANAIAERAPQGQLDSSEKFFDLLLSTIRINPEWQRRIAAHSQTMQQIELKGVRDRSAIVAQSAEDIRNIHSQSYQNQQRSQDRIYAQYSESLRDVETYRNPSTGETIELSNQYGHAWVNNRGEYLLSDQESFDPNVALQEEWKRLEHIRP